MFVALVLSAPLSANAQGFRVTGRVIRLVEGDSVPLPRRQVVLHEITRTRGGPVDSARTDRAGRYRLQAPALDTAATYIVSVQHDGIGYFSDAVHAFGSISDTALTLVVHDTTHGGPPIVLAERHFVIRAPQEQGARRVVELLVLRNEGSTTRVSADSADPVWVGSVPVSALQFEVGNSDVSAQAVARRGDSLLVFSPIPPGDRQLLVSYVLPLSDRFVVPVDPAAGMLNVLLEETSATVTGGPVAFAGAEQLDAVPFSRFSGGPIAAGTAVSVQFSTPEMSLLSFWWVIVVATGSALALALWWWLHTQRQQPAVVHPDVIAAQIVALDADFARLGDGANAQQRDHYRQRRAELKQRLTELLGTRP